MLSVDVSAANAGTIDRTANAIAGHVEAQITHGSTTDSTWVGVQQPDLLSARRNPTVTIALVDGANIAWDADDGLFARVTLGGNRTLANPTNVQLGDVLILEVVQDATGGRTLAYGSNFSGPMPTLEGGANEVTVLTFLALGSNRLLRGPAIAA